MKTFFKKLEYRFLVESAKIENASFPYKTAIPEANVKTNRMVSTNYFIFLKNLVSVWQPHIKSWFDVPTTQMHIFYFL